MFDSDVQSYYEILDVKPDAGPNEIRQAYLRTKSAYSKDSAALYSLFDESETKRILEKIEQAYHILSSPEKRREYDKVHGFIRNHEAVPTMQKPAPAVGTPKANVFSFESGSLSGKEPGQQAGPSPSVPPTAGGAGSVPQSVFDEELPSGPSPEVRLDPIHDGFATPRTLASLDAAGPPAQDYSAASFGLRENRLGIIRRVDLSKPFDPKPELDSQIAAEKEYRGEFIKRVREYRNVTVEELSDFTKISKNYINCLENEEYESLPAAPYLRGFVVQIAKALKLPHEKAAAGYMAHYRAAMSARQPQK